jgi:hypothetical protein
VYAWRGLDEPRFEVAFVDLEEDRLAVQGTQLGPDYRLDYALETASRFVSERLWLECRQARGTRTVELRRGSKPLKDEVLDVDLAFSPLFNSLPVLRDRLHQRGVARDYVMALVGVPDLAVSRSEQRYLPLEEGRVRFRSGTFSADIEFDRDGFVRFYPELAESVSV